ncbi:SAV_2336 N-terminal domain-related protein [Streptomyces sp. Lzd4kr]|nr:SAV_2336 N-terminal domain-related protein [Streptomyces sp. Lzd4kr]
MSEHFDRVLVALEAIGIEPAAREAAEALWLATHIARSADTTAPQAAPGPGPGKDALAPERKQHQARPAEADIPAALHAPNAAAAAPALDESTTRAVTVRVADAPALPHGLELMRALRPLKRKVPSRHRVSLDETATAERSAEERLFLPATRPEPERWLSLALIVDTGPTMSVWHPLVSELTLLLQRTGAFRDIRLWYLHTTPDDTLGLHPRAIPTGALHSPREILDPTGRQAVWCVSDCVSTPWHDGRADRILETWGRSGPLAIIQPCRNGSGAAPGCAPSRSACTPSRPLPPIPGCAPSHPTARLSCVHLPAVLLCLSWNSTAPGSAAGPNWSPQPPRRVLRPSSRQPAPTLPPPHPATPPSSPPLLPPAP